MEIFPSAPPAQQASSKAAASAITADFQTFLRLLTTQMQNQDPLNPMETTEFASQLAQFSGVEQQVRTNDLLTGLQTSFATMGMGQFGDWIGMEVRAEMPVNYQGQTVTIAGAPNALADRMDLVVRNERGEEVQNIPLPLGSETFEWTGRDPSGASVPQGIYTFSIRNWTADTILDDRAAMIYSTVQEAQLVGQDIWLTMDGGLSIPAQSVLGLRHAGG